MADITDPVALEFLKNTVRPLCQKLRALDAEMQAAVTTWNLIRTPVTNTTDTVVDGRQAEGVSQLTGADLHNVMSTIVPALLAVMATGNYRLYTAKPCVRPMQVND